MRIISWLAVSLVALAGCGGGAGAGGSSGGGTTNSGTASIGATGRALYVLVGGSARPANADLFLDPRLASGEIFILAKSPLTASTLYTVVVNASTGTETFNQTWSFTTGSSNALTSQSTPLAELNALRAQCSVSLTPFSTHAGYVTSSTKHAGYQSEIDALTHGELDTVKRFYVNNAFDQRITSGCTSAADPGTYGWGTNINMVGEDIASNGGVAAIANLWNTVYHRLPMMRSQYTKLGVADRTDAYAHPYNNSPYSQVITNNTPAYLTIDFGGNTSIAQVQSFWPGISQSNVYYSFASDNEGPDPISSTNSNGTPDANAVGVPIHVILPTTNNFTALTISVSP